MTNDGSSSADDSPGPADSTGADEEQLLREALACWRWKIRGVTAAIVMLVVGLAAVPVLVLELIPGLSALAIPTLSGGIASVALALAVPVAEFVGRHLTPTPSEGAAGGSGGGDAGDGISGTLGEQARFEAELLLENLLSGSRVGEWAESYRTGCLVLTKGTAGTGGLLGLSGAALLGLSMVPTPLPAPMSLFVGPGLAFEALAAATLRTMPLLLEERGDDAVDEPEPVVRERPTGLDLVERLRRSSVYRRQVRCEHELEGSRRTVNRRGLELLLDRYPRLRGRWIRETGIEELTESQTRALETLLEGERATSRSSDYAFVGPPGSGRSTLANLLTFGSLLHREGTVYCVSAESTRRRLLQESGSTGRARGPHRQFESWVRADRDLRDRVEVAFSDRGETLQFDSPADVYFTDVRRFAEDLLESTSGEEYARRALQRMRYLVIDHPNRLTREELVRLRIAVARVRLVAELLGQELSVLVLLPSYDNAQGVAKWLLNNDDIRVSWFAPWHDRTHVVGWQPPLEFVGEEFDGTPQFGRASFVAEAEGIVTELVRAADVVFDRADPPFQPVHIGVIDPRPMFGPEARRRLHQQIIRAVGESTPAGEPPEINVDLSFLGTSAVAVDRDRAFEVLVCLGLGAYPGRLVNSLRPALRPDGVLILMSDSSPEDLGSLREISEEGWRPPAPHLDDAGRADDAYGREPALSIPQHSEAVVASELCALFADFEGVPVSTDRLEGAFPGAAARELLADWRERGWLVRVDAFRGSEKQAAPRPETHLVHRGDHLRRELHEIPWGCVSRDVVETFDRTANAEVSMRRRELARYVDLDRLFIDLYPGAMLRVPPNSVEVDDFEPREPTEQEESTPGFVERGRLELRQSDKSESIPTDRRALRTRLEIDGEYLLDFQRYEQHVGGEGPVSDGRLPEGFSRALHLEASEGDVRPAAFELAADPTDRPTRAGARMVAGAWMVAFDEQFHDSVVTRHRLIEEPVFVHSLRSDALLRRAIRRKYETRTVSIFLENLGDDSSGRTAGTGGRVPDLGEALADRPSVHALARLVALFLRRRFVHFDREYSVDVVRNAADVDRLAPWRIVVRGRRRGERGTDRRLERALRDRLPRSGLEWMRGVLEGCHCEDGCAACCGGLGTVGADDAPESSDLWKVEDRVSRRGAYVLVCELLGRAPDWARYRRGDRRQRIGEVPEPVGEGELPRLVDEVVGTDGADYRDGLWHELFGEHAEFAEIVASGGTVARASWWDQTDHAKPTEEALGLYVDGEPEVLVERELSPMETRRALLHEYVHNWQYQTDDGFNHRLHRRSSEARRYFDGRLVLEGHARWAEHMLALHDERGPIHTIRDPNAWDEYKVGFFLCAGIERAFGQRGLFLWLRHGEEFDPDEHGPAPRSRNPDLPDLQFSLEEALRAFDLETEARTGTFDGIDIVASDADKGE